MKRLELFTKGVEITRHEDVFGNIHLTARYNSHCVSCVIPYSNARTESTVRCELKKALKARAA